MIRIDEIYSHTFWHWIKQNRPSTRMFTFFPFGRTDPASLISYEQDAVDYNFTLFFDQEPINLARHKNTFMKLHLHQMEMDFSGPCHGHLITSEKNSDTVEHLSRFYGWRTHYYFFHGWAALDWYRGYDRTFLIPEPDTRKISRTFIMPNRIIGGERTHRLILLYWIFKHQLNHNWISCPDQCPAEQISVHKAAAQLSDRYPDITNVFAQQNFPLSFPGESDAPMHSYCLSLFDQCADSLLYLVTETVATGRRWHLTEKIFKPICLRMPFVLASTQGSLAYLRSYGFQTFGELWDESYDDEADDHARLEHIGQLLADLDCMSVPEKQDLFERAMAICEHNYQHFYSGGFESILWKELTGMLNEL
jgi:hypothetical protein